MNSSLRSNVPLHRNWLQDGSVPDGPIDPIKSGEVSGIPIMFDQYSKSTTAQMLLIG